MPTPEEEAKVRKAASMKYWWPKLEQCEVVTPDTTVINVRDWDEAVEISEGIFVPDCTQIVSAVESYGTPAFIRTDQASHKHNMQEASKVLSTDEESIRDTVFELLRHNKMAGFSGLPWRDIVVREWLDLKHSFKAFNETPIAAEVRVFIYQNEVKDYGFYWPEDAIEQHYSHQTDLPDDWKQQRFQLERDTLSHSDQFCSLAETVAEEFDGYWSVDFAQTVAGEWYAIDMAPGIASYKPDSCTKPETIEGLALGGFE